MDYECLALLDDFRKHRPDIPLIVDTDTDATDAASGGDFDRAILEGLEYDTQLGSKGWSGLEVQVKDENQIISLAYTSGTTAKPKGVEYTHRGLYLAALGNVVESGMNIEVGGERAKYLWTLPMFHVSELSILPSPLTRTGQRMDVPMEPHQRESGALLLAKDRLPRDLAPAKDRRHHALQRRANRQHPAVRRQERRAT